MPEPNRDWLMHELRQAAAQDNTDEALSALHAVAEAAGILTATYRAGSVTEIGQLIAAEVKRLRTLSKAIDVYSSAEPKITGNSGILSPGDPMKALVTGEGPWTVSYQLHDATGRVVIEGRSVPMVFGERCRLEIGPADVEVTPWQ